MSERATALGGQCWTILGALLGSCWGLAGGSAAGLGRTTGELVSAAMQVPQRCPWSRKRKLGPQLAHRPARGQGSRVDEWVVIGGSTTGPRRPTPGDTQRATREEGRDQREASEKTNPATEQREIEKDTRPGLSTFGAPLALYRPDTLLRLCLRRNPGTSVRPFCCALYCAEGPASDSRNLTRCAAVVHRRMQE